MTEPWTVLVVEDDPVLRDLMRRILDKREYQVLVAECGTDALEIASTHPGPIDLLITDIVMPGLDGFDVADRLTTLLPMLRVLFLTGYSSDSAYVSDRLRSERGALLRKPFTQVALLDQVEDVLQTSLLRLA